MRLLKRILAVAILAITAAVAIATSVWFGLYQYNSKNSYLVDSKIVLTDEVVMKLGESYQLAPYLINESSEVEYGQYLFASDSREISVSNKGLIKANAMPTNGKAIITVTEQDRGISKQVEVRVIDGVSDIFLVKCVSDNVMLRNSSFDFGVLYNPENASLEGLVEYNTYDLNGNLVPNVFELNIERNILHFKAVGLGKGVLKLKVKNTDGSQYFELEQGFDIRFKDIYLNEAVIGDKLLSETAADNIAEIRYSGTRLDSLELKMLPSLKRIYFTNTKEACSLLNYSDSYDYYFNDEIANRYLEDSLWIDRINNVFIFSNTDPAARYVIYISNVGKENQSAIISKITEDFTLTTNKATGYINDKWSYTADSTSTEATADEIIASSEKTVRLYAIWHPINYTIEYHTTIGGEKTLMRGGVSQFVYNYDSLITPYDIYSFRNSDDYFRNRGYEFLGWTTEREESTELTSNPIEVPKLVADNSSKLTAENNSVIRLYDVWRPIKYTITLNGIADAKKSEYIGHNGEKIVLDAYYNEPVTLSTYNYIGFKITGWVNKNAFNTIYAPTEVVSNLTRTEGVNIELEPQYVEKSYRINIFKPADNAIGSELVLDSDASTNYLGVIKLPELELIHSIKDYFWYIDLDNDNTYDDMEPNITRAKGASGLTLRDINLELIRSGLSIDAINYPIKFKPNPLHSSYTVKFELAGGKIFMDNNGVIQEDGYTARILKESTLRLARAEKSGYDWTGFDVITPEGTVTYERAKFVNLLLTNAGVYAYDGNATYNFTKVSDSQEIIIRPKFVNAEYYISYEGLTTQTKVVYLEKPSLETIVKEGHVFHGWYLEPEHIRPFTNDDKYTFTGDIKLYPKFSIEEYNIVYTYNDGNMDKVIKAKVKYNEKLIEVSRPGYEFKNWKVKEENSSQKYLYMPDLGEDGSSYTLIANFDLLEYELYFQSFYDCYATVSFKDINGNQMSYQISADYGNNGSQKFIAVLNNNTKVIEVPVFSQEHNDWYISIPYSQKVDISYGYRFTLSKSFKVTLSDGISGVGSGGNGSWSFTMPNNSVFVTGSSVYDEPPCVAEGTLITLADGSQKRVEDINIKDMLRIYDHTKGLYAVAPIEFIEINRERAVDMITLEFINGLSTKLINEHAYFNLTLNKYVFINSNNYKDYIGHSFALDNGLEAGYSEAILKAATLKHEVAISYEIVTLKHLNFIADGLLSAPAVLDSFVNLFEYDKDTLGYKAESINEAVKQYGLYTYDDFKDYVPYEIFEKYNAAYLRISVGRGLITREEIIQLYRNYYLTDIDGREIILNK